MIINTFTVGPLQCNCTILGDEKTREAIVIDPGDDPGTIIGHLEKEKLILKQIICTHAHIDHVAAIHELQQQSSSPACIHEKDLFLLDNLEAQAEWIGIPTPPRGEIDRFLSEGDIISCQNMEVDVIHTPGHTPGSLTFHLAGDRPILFTGDTIFLNSIGRTDLWGGSFDELIQSIEQKLMVFDETTLIVPGHGPNTTIGQEKVQNPFLR